MERCIEVLNADDPRWNEYLGYMPVRMQDIYFTSQYHLLGETGTDGCAQMFAYLEGVNSIGIYTFIKRPIVHTKIREGYYDIETVYGYGGPLINTENTKFAGRFEEAFLNYCRQENIVAEFIRFHPLIKNETVFRKDIQVLHNRKTVVIDLTSDIEDIWMRQISAQNRNTIRKCIKNNLSVEIMEDYEIFRDIYHDTMKRVDAAAFYLFGQEYFDAIRKYENSICLCVKSGEQIIAAAMFMGYGEYFHYHLSGSRQEYLRLSPNNILLWEAIKYAKIHGYKKMHLGGGRTDSTDDSLFQFKSRFSKMYADFYIGKRVHNKTVYETLIHQWEEKNGRKAKLLLQYRE